MSPRHKGAELSAENLIPHARLYGPHHEAITANVRDWKDFGNRQKLYVVSEALKQWASRFEEKLVAAVAAGAVSTDSLGRFLRWLGQRCVECGPANATGHSARSKRDDEHGRCLRELEEILTAIESLNEFVTGREVFYAIDPHSPMIGENVGMDRDPPCDETDLYLRGLLHRQLDGAEEMTRPADMTLLDTRLRNIAKLSITDLQTAMDDPIATSGGMGADEVESAVLRLPAGSPEIQIHEDMKQVLADLHELAFGEEAAAATPGMWAECANCLLASWEPWADKCLHLHELHRSTKQSKKKRLRRQVACVTQYAYVMSGAEGLGRFVQVVQCLEELGDRMQRLLLKIENGEIELPAGADVEVQKMVQELDRLIVDDETRGRWVEQFGTESARAGKAVDTIITAGNGQDAPWQQGDKRSFLADAGVLTGEDDATSEQFEQLLFRMQQVAVAIQIPHDLIEGKPMRPKHTGDKLHAGEDWLVNPLATVLVHETTPEPARRKDSPATRSREKAERKKKPKKSSARRKGSGGA